MDESDVRRRLGSALVYRVSQNLFKCRFKACKAESQRSVTRNKSYNWRVSIGGSSTMASRYTSPRELRRKSGLITMAGIN